MKLYAEVIFPLPLSQKFLYRIPEIWINRAKVGSRVLTLFHNRTLTGFIVGLKKRLPTARIKLKDVIEVLDEEPIFTPNFLTFTRKLSEHYYSSWGELLQAALPSSFILKSKSRVFISEKGREFKDDKSLSPEERKLLGLFKQNSYSNVYIKKKMGLKNLSSLLASLESRELISIEKEIPQIVRKKIDVPSEGPTQLEMDFSLFLDKASIQATRDIFSSIGREVFSPFYLYGPVEKREAVFFNLMKEILGLKKSSLFLVPEITLTQDLSEKLMKRYGERVALIHSQMTPRQKEIEWQRIKNGEVQIVAGPRSALFSPIKNLGLVIVDEEQDESYYQKESPSYDARQGAWIRSQLESAIMVFGSSSPSIEGYYWAKKKKYLVPLRSEALSHRTQIFEYNLSKGLIDYQIKKRIQKRMERGERVLVFYNRRGYAPYLICSNCSSIPRCPRCDIALTYHKSEQKLICHYCNYTSGQFARCSLCGGKIILGRSFGIEAVEEELKKLFPKHRIASFNLDVVGTKRDQEILIQRFVEGKIDVLIGTQLLAHRKDVPKVSTVIALFPETTLALSDFRASQKAFVNLSQLMFFLDRDKPSEFLIQTSSSPHYSIRLAATLDFQTFYKRELESRRVMNYPPYACMVEIIFSGENLRSLAQSSRQFLASIKQRTSQIEVLGPALASVSRVRGQSRVQVVLKSKRKRELDEVLLDCLRQVKTRKSVYVYE